MDAIYSADDIKHAQAMLDLHDDSSPYWDTRKGQDDLNVIVDLNMVARVPNNQREELRREIGAT